MANEIVNFIAAANFAVGADPYSATVADFNSDGSLDLAVGNYATSNVSVLLGNGAGGFSAATNFLVGPNPFTIVTADFNSDGKADLVTSGYQDGKISLLLGNGNGSFAAATNFLAGAQLIDVAVGDFNRDGKPDLAVADDSTNLAVLLGDGLGGFATPTKLALGTTPISVNVGDANGDGIADLISANSASTDLSILFGTGTGGFSAVNNVAVGNRPAVATVGDFNQDGIPDLATANYAVNNIGVLLGTGNGQFGAATNYAVGSVPFSLSVKDLNGDGQLDLTTVNNLGNSVSVLLGTGTGSFAPVKNFAVGDNPGFGTVADFNRDGRFDIVSVNRGTNNVSVLLNNTTIIITPQNQAPVVANPIPTQAIALGSALNFTLAANTFTDPDPGDVLSYTAKLANGSPLPTWLTFNPTTKTFTGTPGAGNVGAIGITVTARDQAGLTVADDFNLTVTGSPQNNQSPVVANPIPAQAIALGSALNFTLATNTFTDPDAGDVLSYTAKLANGSPLPTWLTFNPTTKTFAGTPGAGNLGVLGIVVTAKDQAGLTVTDDFDLTVTGSSPTGGQTLVLDIVKLDATQATNPAVVKIDLTSYAGKSLKADITTTASAAYTNNVGFYTIEDASGSIRLADGSLIKPGDLNYADAAVKNALTNSLQAGKNDSQLNLSIADGRIYAPIVISQGSLTDFLAKNSTNAGGANEIHAYFNYIGANPDKTEHFRLVSNNTFGFEDLYGGGDKDFNDLVVTMNVKTV
jgi:Putative Ig domain/FG-GAP-like repeat/Domain of unknown function (DUF4114)